MDLQLAGKRALVTGSTSGIGAACAKALAREGVSVIVTGRDEARARRVTEEISAFGQARYVIGTLSTDASAQTVAEGAVNAFGGVDIVVNNAASYGQTTWETLTPDVWLGRLNDNLVSIVRLIRLLAPAMQERRWGRFIQMSSSGAAVPRPYYADYAAAKAGLLALTVASSKQYAQFGITSNAIGVGITRTPPIREMVANVAAQMNTSPEEAERHLCATSLETPAGRFADPEEIADLVCYLASPRANYITGATYRIDGGHVPTYNP